MPSDGDKRPSERPEYNVYRSRRGFFSRFRKPTLDSLKQKERSRSGAGQRAPREQPEVPYPVYRQTAPPDDRPDPRKRSRRRRPWLKWILFAVIGWFALSVAAFAVSAQIQSMKLDGDAKTALDGNPWLLPWSNAVGTQTMYCSDCHGSDVVSPASVIPNGGENGEPWGPHGSNNNFILKGAWNNNSATLCFKCHDRNVYSPVNDTRKDDRTTGFCCRSGDQLHWYHWNKITGSSPAQLLKCNWCHAAVPHGWKNKALLVNLNDVGPEAGQAGNAEWRMGAGAQAYNQEPYYLNAKLKVLTFAASGSWTDANCGSRGSGTVFGPNTNNANTGKDWMKDVCSNPP